MSIDKVERQLCEWVVIDRHGGLFTRGEFSNGDCFFDVQCLAAIGDRSTAEQIAAERGGIAVRLQDLRFTHADKAEYSQAGAREPVSFLSLPRGPISPATHVRCEMCGMLRPIRPTIPSHGAATVGSKEEKPPTAS